MHLYKSLLCFLEKVRFLLVAWSSSYDDYMIHMQPAGILSGVPLGHWPVTGESFMHTESLAEAIATWRGRPC